jgi:glutamate-ammonia-ligase adenylyltransferase
LVAGDVPGAFDLLSRVLVAARLLAPDGSVPDAAPCASLAKSCGFGDWNAMIEAMEGARAAIARQWTATFGQQLAASD